MFFLKKKPNSPRPEVPKPIACVHEYQIIDVHAQSQVNNDYVNIYDLVCSNCQKHKEVDEMTLTILSEYFNIKDGKGNLL